jgi:hypothetical protein
LCALAIAYISSRFARISSSMHIYKKHLYDTTYSRRFQPSRSPRRTGRREFREPFCLSAQQILKILMERFES